MKYGHIYSHFTTHSFGKLPIIPTPKFMLYLDNLFSPISAASMLWVRNHPLANQLEGLQKE